MAAEHILYLPRLDSDGEYVLINVSSGGSSPLDLKLLATEGEFPYTAMIRQSRMSKLRDKKNLLSQDQWEDILRLTLLQRRSKGSAASSLEKLEVLASLGGDQLSVMFRNNIAGITQKLGEIVFKKDESQELDIVRWAGVAVQRSNSLDRDIRDLTIQCDEQSAKIDKLNDQLEMLIKAKTEHEHSLLQKFRELLNSKKLKIREQRRLLATAKIDPKQAAKFRDESLPLKTRAATASRARKRKSEGSQQASESSEDSRSEKRAPTQVLESDLSEQMYTPGHSDQDLTEDESGDDPDSAHQAATVPERGQDGNGAKGIIGEQMQLDVLRPVRDLPVSEGGKREQQKPPATGDNSRLTPEAGNEEETDDDEL